MSTSVAKKAIMTNRKPKSVEITPVNKAHEIYLFVQKYPGMTEEEYRKGLVKPDGDITYTDINSALKQFVKTGRMTEKQFGRGNKRYSVYEVDPDVEYIPRPVMRKIAPNDKKALQAVARKTTKQDPFCEFPTSSQTLEIPTDPVAKAATPASEVADISVHRERKARKQNFEMIQGLAAIDPNHPGFQEAAKEILDKVTPTELPKEEVSTKPILEAMFFMVGSQSVTATPSQLRQLYDELHALFGKK